MTREGSGRHEHLSEFSGSRERTIMNRTPFLVSYIILALFSGGHGNNFTLVNLQPWALAHWRSLP